jgi:hypothetical protein
VYFKVVLQCSILPLPKSRAFQKAKCKLQQQEQAFWKARCPLSYWTHSIGVGGLLLKMPTSWDQVLAQLSPRHRCLGLYTTYVEHESIFVLHQFNDNLSIPSLVYIDGWLEYEQPRLTYNNSKHIIHRKTPKPALTLPGVELLWERVSLIHLYVSTTPAMM